MELDCVREDVGKTRVKLTQRSVSNDARRTSLITGTSSYKVNRYYIFIPTLILLMPRLQGKWCESGGVGVSEGPDIYAEASFAVRPGTSTSKQQPHPTSHSTPPRSRFCSGGSTRPQGDSSPCPGVRAFRVGILRCFGPGTNSTRGERWVSTAQRRVGKRRFQGYGPLVSAIKSEVSAVIAELEKETSIGSAQYDRHHYNHHAFVPRRSAVRQDSRSNCPPCSGSRLLANRPSRRTSI